MTEAETWPDGTPKSMNNAFNWRVGKATAVPFVANKNQRALDLHSHGNIYTYTQAAKPSNKYTGGKPPKGNVMFTIKKQ